MTRTAGKLRYMPTPSLLDDSKNIVGESPLWHPEEGSLYWTDVNGFRIHRHILKSGEKQCWSNWAGYRGLGKLGITLSCNARRQRVGLGHRLWHHQHSGVEPGT